MKKILLSLLAVGAIFTASAQMKEGAQARVYAYDLKINSEKVVTFKTNTVATTAKVIIDGITEEVVATSNDGKNWTAIIEPTAAYTAGTEYNWSIEVSANPVKEFTEIMNSLNPYRSFGLAINTNPESDYFGSVYMTHQYTKTGRMANGIYTYDPLLNQTNYKAFDFIGEAEGSAASASGVSPRDMNIAEDGRLFMTNYSKANSNVYWVSPDLKSSGALFSGNLDTSTGIRTDNEGNYNSGLNNGIAVRGGGESTQLYVTDHCKGPATNAYVMRYDIGSNSTWSKCANWELNSFAAADDSSISYIANTGTYSGHAMETTKNGFWVAAFRGTPDKSYPDLFYYNEKTGNRDFVSYTDLTNDSIIHSNNSIALALNERLGLVAYTVHIKGNSQVYARVFSFEEKNDKMSVNYIADYDISATLGKKADAMAFDYAGNLYALTSGNEDLTAYALPLADNTCTTPAKKSLTISFTQGEIEATGIESIEAENAPVEYYNLQGVKVENPSNGIFIKKQGNKTTKVVL